MSCEHAWRPFYDDLAWQVCANCGALRLAPTSFLTVGPTRKDGRPAALVYHDRQGILSAAVPVRPDCAHDWVTQGDGYDICWRCEAVRRTPPVRFAATVREAVTTPTDRVDANREGGR